MTTTCLGERRHIARKAHRCDACARAIEPGTRYVVTVHTGDDRVYSWRRHEVCDAMIDELALCDIDGWWWQDCLAEDERWQALINVLEWLGMWCRRHRRLAE